MTTLADVEDFPASLLVGDFLLCRRCGVVDRDHTRIRVDTQCPSCKQPAGHAQLYYHIGIQILIDLTQQAYHSESAATSAHAPQSANVAVVLFFCTLREALLDQLLKYLFLAHNVSDAIAEKLLKDNRLFGQKLFGVLPALIGVAWDKAVEEASSNAGRDFGPVSKFMEEAAGLRNRFIHEGSAWAITREVATDCMNSIFSMLGLFVSLHNVYAKPHLRADDL